MPTGDASEHGGGNTATTQDPPPHPPVLSRAMPRKDARGKRKAKAQTIRSTPVSPSQSDIDGEPLSSPCPSPGASNHTSKRKRIAGDVGLADSRRGSATIVQAAPSSAPVQSTYRWMTRQATPGPSNDVHEDNTPYDLRHTAPRFEDQPSINGFFDATLPPFTQVGPLMTTHNRHDTNTHMYGAPLGVSDQRNPRAGPPHFLHPSSSLATGDVTNGPETRNGRGRGLQTLTRNTLNGISEEDVSDHCTTKPCTLPANPYTCPMHRHNARHPLLPETVCARPRRRDRPRC